MTKKETIENLKKCIDLNHSVIDSTSNEYTREKSLGRIQAFEYAIKVVGQDKTFEDFLHETEEEEVRNA